MAQPERRETRETICGEPCRQGFHALGGGEIRWSNGQKSRGRAQRFYVPGADGWNLAIDFDKGLFHDKVEDVGGDLIWLACRINNWTTAKGLKWSEDEGYRTPSRRLNAAEIAAQRQRREAEDRRRIDVADFRRGLDAELDRLKIQTLDSGDDEGLEAAASLQFRLSQQPEDVMSQMLSSDGARVRGLIELAREDRGNAAQITARIVGMLAGAELERERAEALHRAA